MRMIAKLVSTLVLLASCNGEEEPGLFDPNGVWSISDTWTTGDCDFTGSYLTQFEIAGAPGAQDFVGDVVILGVTYDGVAAEIVSTANGGGVDGLAVSEGAPDEYGTTIRIEVYFGYGIFAENPNVVFGSGYTLVQWTYNDGSTTVCAQDFTSAGTRT